MSVILYINGNIVDLDDKAVIAQTKQVNDINTLQDRQASYTNKFKAPKTAKNIKTMGFASLTGNLSNIPYQKNECYLYSDTGECFIYKGWAIIKDAGNSYDIALYDGIIDLYKLIENKSLADLDLTELDHDKNVANVIATWDFSTIYNYRYITADFNGNTGDTTNGEINIDYLVPSVWIPYLWQKIQDVFGVTFEGTVFQTQNFRNFWMTYPKGLQSGEEDQTIIFKSDDFAPIVTTGNSLYQPTYNTTLVNDLAGSIDNIYLQVPTTGSYFMKIKGTLFGKRGQLEANAKIKLRINLAGEQISYVYDFLNSPQYFEEGANDAVSGEEFEFTSQILQLQEFDDVSLLIGNSEDYGAYQLFAGDANELDIELIRVDPPSIEFGDELTDFSIRDFITEIIYRFGLTMFKEPYSSTYTFLTLEEQLQNAELVDWSDKFSSKDSENYIVGTYAQQNYFRHNYNDKESDYNDGFIGIDNVNLQDTKDLVKSKIYSPEKIQVQYLNRTSNVYKLWDKEIKEDEAEPNYKPLDKRYYFVRAEIKSFVDMGFGSPFTVISNELGQSQNAGFVWVENFSRLSYSNVIQDYYTPIAGILNKSIAIKATMQLNKLDIVNFDFKKLYYIDQLSNYFIVNKINNYIPGKLTKVDLTRVIYGGVEELISDFKSIVLKTVEYLSPDMYKLTYSLNYVPEVLVFIRLEISLDGLEWLDVDGSATNNYEENTVDLTGLSYHYVRVTDNTNEVQSNFLPV